jgi:hypothetical protein
MEYSFILRNARIDVPILFFCNIDEIRHFDWAEVYTAKAYVPTHLTIDQAPVPVNRAEKRITFV